MYSIKNIFLVLFISLFFISCASNNAGLNKVYETDYPDGISLIIHNDELRSNLEINSARLVKLKYKKQVQMVINNKSSDTYNVIVENEWIDSRGSVINNRVHKRTIVLEANSSKRVVLTSSSYKAVNSIINISCSQECIKN